MIQNGSRASNHPAHMTAWPTAVGRVSADGSGLEYCPPPFDAASSPGMASVPPTNLASAKPPRPTAKEDAEQARRVEYALPALYLENILSSTVGDVGDANVMGQYLQSVAARCGSSDDPLQRMLVDQIVMAHHRIGRLHIASAEAQTPEAALAYSSAAVKLQAEVRQSMQALRSLQRVPMQTGVFVKHVVRVRPQEGAAQEPQTPN